MAETDNAEQFFFHNLFQLFSAAGYSKAVNQSINDMTNRFIGSAPFTS